MKKTVFGCGAALALLAILSGCPGVEEPPPRVKLTITDLDRDETWVKNAIAFSITVYGENATIELDNKAMTQLGGTGKVAEGFGLESNTTRTSISCTLPEFPPGNYVLVLGASSSTTSGSGASGAMVITGSGSSRGTVEVDETYTVDSSEFIKNTDNTGWQVSALIEAFKDPPTTP